MPSDITPTNFEYFCYSMANPFNSPADLFIPEGTNPAVIGEYRKLHSAKMPLHLKNSIVRTILVFLCYITIIPAIFLHIKGSSSTAEVNQKLADVKKTKKSKKPTKAADDETEHPISDRLRFIRSLNRASFAGSRVLDTLKELGSTIAFVNEDRDNADMNGIKTELIGKTYELKDDILRAAEALLDNDNNRRAVCVMLDKILLLPLLDDRLGSTDFNTRLISLQRTRTIALAKSITRSSTHANQFNYENAERLINTGDARGSCGSIALAWLIDGDNPNFDPIAEGHRIHQTYGLDAGAYAHFDDDIVTKNPGISTDDDEYLSDTEIADSPVVERYTYILDNIEEDSYGLIQVGSYFFAIKKNEDESIEIYDSHGSGVGLDETTANASTCAYSASFDNIEEAAAFLSVHRNPYVGGTVNHQIEFQPLTIDDDIHVESLHTENKTRTKRSWRWIKNKIISGLKGMLSPERIKQMLIMAACVYCATNVDIPYDGEEAPPGIPSAYPIDTDYSNISYSGHLTLI